MFPTSVKASGAGLSMLDVCLTPSPMNRLPLPYATQNDNIVITFGGPNGVKTVYKSKSDGTVNTLKGKRLSTAETFIIGQGGAVSGHPRPCRTPRAALMLVSAKLGAGATATVISSDEKDEYPIAFRVTARTVRRIMIVRNPKDWLSAVRGQ